MGMCKRCGEIFGADELKNGYCKNCQSEAPNNTIKTEDENEYCIISRLKFIFFGLALLWSSIYIFNDNLIINGSEKLYMIFKIAGFIFGAYSIYFSLIKKCYEFED